MSALPRFFCCPIIPPRVELVAEEFHHLAHVLRLKSGAEVEVFDGEGTLAVGILTAVKKRHAEIEIVSSEYHERPARAAITLAPAIAKGDRFEWLIEKCTELGVDQIAPALYTRSVKLGKNPRIVRRWRYIAVTASKQSRRLYVPTIEPPQEPAAILKEMEGENGEKKIFFGDFAGGAFSDLVNHITTNVIVFIGPEGGWTEPEKELFLQHGGGAVRLGETVLRIETAALAFAVLLCQFRR